MATKQPDSVKFPDGEVITRENFIKDIMTSGVSREAAEGDWPDFVFYSKVCGKVAENPSWPLKVGNDG